MIWAPYDNNDVTWEELGEYFSLDDERRRWLEIWGRHFQMQAHISELHCQLMRKHAQA